MRTLIAAVSILLGPEAALAQTSSPSERGPDYNGDDLTRPESKFQLRLEDKTSGTTSTTDTITLYMQPQGIFDLGSGWGLSWLAQVPVVWKSTPGSGSNPSSKDFGPGDIELEAVLIRPIDERWAFGFGARLITPSAEDRLGNGKWQILPGFGIRYSFSSNTYFVPKIRYAVSFGGDPSRRDISEPQIAPTFNIGLPNRWFVTLYPSFDIRINFGEPSSGQTGKLFFPFDASVGRKLSDNIVMSLEVSVPIVKDYPVYNFKSELRFSAKF